MVKIMEHMCCEWGLGKLVSLEIGQTNKTNMNLGVGGPIRLDIGRAHGLTQ